MSHDVSWVTPYLRTPWVSGGRGPDCYDCWGWLRAVYADQFGIDLPEYAGVDATNDAVVSMLLTTGAQGSDWYQLVQPIHGCAVAMGHGGRISHVGVYLEVDGGLVLHCQRDMGVVLHSVADVKAVLKFSTVTFFRHKKHSLCQSVAVEI